MATTKTFTVAGVSTSTDGTKVRFANDVMRVKVLAKNGHTDITLIELPNDMLKLDAVNFIKALPEFDAAEAQCAIAEYLDKYTPKTKKVVTKPAATAKVETKAKAKTPSKAAIAAAAAELENEPF